MFRQIKFELKKLSCQKKTYIVFFGQILLLTLGYIGFKVSKFNGYWGRTLERIDIDIVKLIDAFFFARVMILPTCIIILPIFICTIAGDIVAGEVQDGSLKLYLSRPRSRINVILSKLAALFVSSVVCCSFFALTSLIVGYALFKSPGTQIIPLHGTGIDIEFVVLPLSVAFERYFISLAYYSFSIMALASITLFFSTVFNRMTTATIAGLTVFFVCHILEAIPVIGVLRPYLFSAAMSDTMLFWSDTIPVMTILHNILILGFYITIFSGLSIIIFSTKDIK